MEDGRRRAWWQVAGWLAIQLTATSLPGSVLPGGLGHPIDFLGHFAMYLVLGALVARAAARGGSGTGAIVLWVVLSAVGALDETHQLLIPGREASAVDWTLDALGAGAGLTLWAALARTRVVAWVR